MVKKPENTNPSVSCSPFAGGDMGQGPFDEQARRGLEQYSQTFGKYLDKDDREQYSEDEKDRRDRAKKANKIYKQVCEELRLSACFFSNFGDWTQYMAGKMSDDEFQSHAVTRAQQMMEEN
ncbi:MAG: hypothetical protein AB9866_14530 [Syntrophobacteraceae bacterium]